MNLEFDTIQHNDIVDLGEVFPRNNVSFKEEFSGTFYELWKTNPKRNIIYKCNEGFINYYHDKTIKDTNNVYIYYVAIHDNLRRQGIFTNFIKTLMDDTSIQKIVILGVGSHLMMNCLKKFGCFKDHGGDFIWIK